MSKAAKFILVLMTAPARHEAKKIASKLIERKEAACVTFFACESMFVWKGKFERDAGRNPSLSREGYSRLNLIDYKAKTKKREKILDRRRISFFKEGVLQSAKEIQLIIKTDASLFGKVKKTILSVTSNQVPEILMIPIEDGHVPYLNWISESVKWK